VHRILSFYCPIFGAGSVMREIGPIGSIHKNCVLWRP